MIQECETIPQSSGNASVRERRTIFISHASPEDNDFVRWLAAQLVIAGYQVWSDVTQLLGGELFWRDIEEAIDSAACRFLFVSTLHGNTKPGALRELKLARDAQAQHNLKDFIVPLKIDAFPFQSMQPGLSDLNIVRFDETWAGGLRQLLTLLEREQIPRSPNANASAVMNWYEKAIDKTRRPARVKDDYLSNWFQLTLPKKIYAHRYRGGAKGIAAHFSSFPHPHRVHEDLLLTFAPPPEVHLHLGDEWASSESHSVKTLLSQGWEALDIASFDASNIVSDLVRQSWEGAIKARNCVGFPLASGLLAFFFARGTLEKDRAFFQPRLGRRTYRQMVGTKSKRLIDGTKVPDGFWHYAVSASVQLSPFPRVVLRHHVIFTDDGKQPWDKPERMHKARRGVCRNWWNREWRDRLLAFCSQLGSGSDSMALATGGDDIQLSMVPMRFKSPVSYFEDNDTGLDETADIELVEDVVDDEDDDDEA